MMNKKGDGHVDWVISIGIFLVFLLSIFVIFRPGMQPSQDYDTLLDILENNVKEDFDISGDHFGGLYWTLYKVPLFIKKGIGNTPITDGCVQIEFPYEVSEDKITVYKIETRDNKETLVSIPKQVNGKQIFINVDNLDSNYKKYMIYFSENGIYSYRSEDLKVVLGGSQIEGCVESSSGSNFDYNIGIAEKTRGIAEDILEILESNAPNKKDYYNDKLKTYYGYPKSKEFSIMVTKEGGDSLEYKPVQPDVKTNVYTREWGDFILNYDGTRTPVKVNLKVW